MALEGDLLAANLPRIVLILMIHCSAVVDDRRAAGSILGIEQLLIEREHPQCIGLRPELDAGLVRGLREPVLALTDRRRELRRGRDT